MLLNKPIIKRVPKLVGDLWKLEGVTLGIIDLTQCSAN